MSINLSQLVDIFGQENVSDAPELLGSYEKSKHLGVGIRPDFVAKVSSADELQKVIKLANETGTALVTVSSEGPHYRGGSNPSVPGAVMLDLSGMKKIRSINRQFRMAVIEPGVTYEELQAALSEHGMTLISTLAPKVGKSVAASLLDVEPRVNPSGQWNYMDPLRCTEVVWGDGQKMGTGEASGPPLEVLQSQQKWQINPRGPALIDYYRLNTAAQGTMGVVSWISVHCAIKPTIHKMYMVPASREEDLIDFTYKVTRFRFGDEIFVMNGANLASLIGKDAEEVAEIQTKLPAWIALVGVSAGEVLPEKKFNQQYMDICEMAQSCGLEMVSSINGISGDSILPKVINPCEPGKYWKETRKGAFADIFFITTLDKTPKFIETMMKAAAEAGLNPGDIGTYIQPQHQGVNVHCEFTIPFNPSNKAETEKAKALFEKASELLSNDGAFYSRPYGKWARLQYNKDAQSTSMLKKLRNIFNPCNSLNPGKLSDY